MKRILILTVLVVAMLAITASAQSKIKFGVKAGVGLADMTGNGWDVAAQESSTEFDHKFKLGFVGGVMAQIPLGESGLMLQPEATYVMKGTKISFPEADAMGLDLTAKIKLNYIEVPILIKYAFPTSGKMSPALFAGPAIAFNVSSKFKPEGADVDSSDFVDGDIYNQKSTDFGIVFGGGVDLKVGEKNKLVFDVRYTLGLVNAFDDVADDANVPENQAVFTDDQGAGLELKNSNIQFTVGLLF